MRHGILTRRNIILADATCAAALGTSGWLLLGPLWSIAGLVLGLMTPTVVVGVALGLMPGGDALLAKGRPEDALRRLRRDEPQARKLARAWPGQWRDFLAQNLAVQAYALQELHRDAQALRAADEAVAICQELAAEKPARYSRMLSHVIDARAHVLAGLGRLAEAIDAHETAIRLFRNLAIAAPGKYLPVLAEALTCTAEWLADVDKNSEALTTAHEATAIYWHNLPGPDLPLLAARAALLEGRLLCQQGRYHEAARMLSRGWTLAARQDQQDAISSANPALKTTYQADPDDFANIWHAETASAPPGWLTS